MCLIGLAWQVHPRYRLVVAANRDEFVDRPTAPAQWWDDHPGVFGGRDARAGGTWMAVTRSGRFAALTNVRRGDEASGEDKPSRGHLVARFVADAMTAQDYVASLLVSDYAGFNLVVCDGSELWWCDDAGASEPLLPGVHTVSNASLDTPWPKTRRLSERMAMALGVDASDDALSDELFDALADRTVAADDDLPPGELPLERRRALSAGMIVTDDYATRASSVVLMGATVWMEERTIVGGGVTGVRQL
jgi:uncharacterized protein with NRDE domain